MGLIAWAVLGFIAGLIAKAFMPDQQPQDCVVTTFLGMAGAMVGGWLANVSGVGGSVNDLSIVSIITAAIGAAIILGAYQYLHKK